MKRRRVVENEGSSLWLSRRREPVEIRIDRFAEYPYFMETMTEYGDPPETALVTWKPYGDFLRPFDDWSAERDWEFVREVEDLIRSGVDVPPLVRWLPKKLNADGDKPFDGIHRAHAAHALEIRLAPTICVEFT